MSTTQIVIGNIVAFSGALIMISIGFIKGKSRILIVQCVQFLVMGIGNLILGGFTGFLTNIVSMLRNLYSFKFKYNWPVKLVFIAAQVALAVRVNNLGLIGWLPIIAASAFTWFLDVKSDLGIKILIVTTQVPWLIYDLYIKSYTGSVFDILSIITNTVGIIMILKSKNADESRIDNQNVDESAS